MQGVPALWRWAHMFWGVDVQQLGDGIVVVALPVLASPVHAVLPVPRPLPQAVPHLLQDLPQRPMVQESWVPAKPGTADAGPRTIL